MANEKSVISYLVILGDSLTDGGELQQSKPLLADATELTKSSNGRFTDGYTWADDLARSAALDIVKEQFIQYIINTVQTEKLSDAHAEIEEFEVYIRDIDLNKFHPNTFSFDKLRDSYLKRHFLKQNIVSYFSTLSQSAAIDVNDGTAFLNDLKSMGLNNFNPDEFDLNELLERYKQKDPSKKIFVDSLNVTIDKSAISSIVQNSKDNYRTAQEDHHNNIFDAIDYEKFKVEHINENLKNVLYGSFSLGNYQRTLFQGHNFIRRFAEGGLSASHYLPLPDIQTLSLILKQVKYNLGEFKLSFQYLASFVGQFFMLLGKILGARAMLSSLEDKTNSVIKDDKVQQISDEDKAKTLVTEWTGANDFITMNAFSSEKVCDDAVKARMDNILKLADAGYKNFLLIDLPDLGKTPRYVNRPEAERNEVTRLVNYFNQKLKQKIEELRKTKPELDIKLFPLSEQFDEIYENPESFGLNKDINKTEPLLSRDPKDTQEGQWMFWDEVHPSNITHRILAQEIYKFGQENYNLQTPKDIVQPCCPVAIAKGLLQTFQDKYKRLYEDYTSQLIGNLSRFFGLGSNKQSFKGINFDPHSIEEARASLAQLYQLSMKDKIVKQSLIDMGWLQKDGQIPKVAIAPILEQAYEMANNSSCLGVSQLYKDQLNDLKTSHFTQLHENQHSMEPVTSLGMSC